MNFSNHTFLTNSVYGSRFTTLTLFISQSYKNKERCAKTRFEFVEMHTNPLDPHLICNYKTMSVRFKFTQPWGLPEHASYSLYKNIQAGNRWSNDIHVRLMILIKTIYYQERFKLRSSSANRRVVSSCR